MSTRIFLECLDHDPPLQSDSESGQHLYDLPTIRADVRDRDALARLWDEGAISWGSFHGNSAKFLAEHKQCRIGIRDEYGVEHPLIGGGSDG